MKNRCSHCNKEYSAYSLRSLFDDNVLTCLDCILQQTDKIKKEYIVKMRNKKIDDITNE